jgi:hypothetical protein
LDDWTPAKPAWLTYNINQTTGVITLTAARGEVDRDYEGTVYVTRGGENARLIVNADLTLLTHNVTITQVAGGAIVVEDDGDALEITGPAGRPTGITGVPNGNTVILEGIADENFNFVHWLVDGNEE